MKCVIHGSFRKHFSIIKEVARIFEDAGIEVIAPKTSEIAAYENDFALFEDELGQDPRQVELLYLHNLKKLGSDGFSYFVNPDGYIGKSASYELGIAQTINVPVFFMEKPDDHPVYYHNNAVISPAKLAKIVRERGELPPPVANKNEIAMHQLWQELVVPSSIVAAGAIIEHQSRKREKEILLVKSYKWGDRFTIIGGKVRSNERLRDALAREVKEETGLTGGRGRYICAFDQIKDSGYYLKGVSQIFVDDVFHVTSKKVRLNEENQDYVWMPARAALAELDIEPNARHTIEIYLNKTKALA